MSDVLFLLRPDFEDSAAGPGMYYCPDCATITGLLSYYPELRNRLEVCEVEFPRPRTEVAAIFGPDHPGCPLLVLDMNVTPPDGMPLDQSTTGRRYLVGASRIQRYLAEVYGIGSAHP